MHALIALARTLGRIDYVGAPALCGRGSCGTIAAINARSAKEAIFVSIVRSAIDASSVEEPMPRQFRITSAQSRIDN